MVTEKRDGKIFKAALNIALLFLIDFIVNFAWSVLVSTAFAAAFALSRGMANESGIYEYLAGSPEFLFAVSFYNVFIILIVKLFWKRFGKNSSDMMGLKLRRNSLKLFSLGLLGGALEMSLIILASFAVGILWYQSSGMGIYGTQEIFRSLFFGILAFLLVGFGEEAIFRGYIQKRLMLSVGNGWALLLGSLIFMAAHLATYARLLDFIDIFRE
jgi:membrane protease YdiL (CAAX protease family)